ELVRFSLTKKRVAALRRSRTATLTVTATNADAAEGAPSGRAIDVTKPLPKKKRRAKRRG
ncbi:MAG: hypothetical protein M3389_03925, partial [Actinomycetota bacterium]|nr:hypothetical protein [Actinomycetota bacterium]